MKKLLILFQLLFFYQCCFAQVSDTPTFLWMVLSKESKTPSFIFGTVHHLGPKAVLNNTPLMNIILKSRIIVQEADTIELFHAEDEDFDLSADTALDVLLGYADYQFVKQEFYLATGSELEPNKNLMPMVIMEMIERGNKQVSGEPLKQPMMENAFYAMSVVKKIPIAGLETRKENFLLMYKTMPLNEQAKLLMYSLKNLKFNDIGEVMKSCFDSQDLQCLCNVENIGSYTRPGDMNILVARNLFWMKRIEKHILDGNAFIAVGAAHLCGKLGIIEMLRKKGYILAPIKLNQ